MSSARDFFNELSNFAPKYTPVVKPMFVGLITFIICVSYGHYYNQRKLRQTYRTNSHMREIDSMSRKSILLIVAIIIASISSDLVYTILDWKQNQMWYVWKYKWFPNLLA